MSARQPSVVVLAGPNGAGKSTAAPALLQGALSVTEFVNADVIARGLSGFQPEKVALTAGRIMWRRLDELKRQRARFAFETTLAGKRFAPAGSPQGRWIHGPHRFPMASKPRAGDRPGCRSGAGRRALDPRGNDPASLSRRSCKLIPALSSGDYDVEFL